MLRTLSARIKHHATWRSSAFHLPTSCLSLLQLCDGYPLDGPSAMTIATESAAATSSDENVNSQTKVNVMCNDNEGPSPKDGDHVQVNGAAATSGGELESGEDPLNSPLYRASVSYYREKIEPHIPNKNYRSFNDGHVNLNFEEWRKRNAASLLAFLEYLENHDIPEEDVVPYLFKRGRRARMLLVTESAHSKDSSESRNHMSWKSRLDLWEEALNSTNIPLPLPYILSKWPTMLLSKPIHLQETVGILHAAFDDDEEVFKYAIREAPWLLGKNPADLNQHIVKLQNVTEGALPRMLAKAPRLLHASLNRTLTNLRYIRGHCYSSDVYCNLIERYPEIALHNPEKMRFRAMERMEGLESVLSNSTQAVSVAHAFPLLLFSNRRCDIVRAWDNLNSALEKVPAWKEELEEILKDVALNMDVDRAAPEASNPDAENGGLNSSNVNANTTDENDDDGRVSLDAYFDGDRTHSSTPEEAIAESLHQDGVLQSPVPIKGREEDVSLESQIRHAFAASQALGQLIYQTCSDRHKQRLQFLAETRAEGAGKVSILAVLNAPLTKFDQKFGDFSEWRKYRM